MFRVTSTTNTIPQQQEQGNNNNNMIDRVIVTSSERIETKPISTSNIIKSSIPCSMLFNSFPKKVSSDDLTRCKEENKCIIPTKKNVTTTTTTTKSCCVKRRRSPIMKTVRFQSFPTKVIEAPKQDRTNIKTWYTRSELQMMKMNARRTCAALKNVEHDIRTSYQTCCNITNTTTKVDDDNVTVLLQQQQQQYDTLVATSKRLCQSKQFLYQRGLERWSSNEHYRTRMVASLACKTNVFIEQSNQFLFGGNKIDGDEKIANVYKSGNINAVKFAHLLAIADHEAVISMK